MAITQSFEHFQYFSFERNSLKNENFFQKLENDFLVESTQTENASFSNKTALSEGSVNENRMVDAKWTCHKERSFASDYLIFKKILFPHKSFL